MNRSGLASSTIPVAAAPAAAGLRGAGPPLRRWVWPLALAFAVGCASAPPLPETTEQTGPADPAPTAPAVVVATPAPLEAPFAPPEGEAVMDAEQPEGGEFDVAALRNQPRVRQKRTEPVHTVKLGTALKRRWATKVGATTFRTTMAQVGTTIVIGTHGATLNGKNEPSDAVYLLDARSGKVRSTIKPPGTGDRDIGGIAVDGDRVYFTTDNGWVVASTLAGNQLWSSRMRGKVRPAPALGDLNGDGQVDVVAGDESGQLVAMDGSSGKRLWSARTGVNEYGNKGFIGAAAIADLDGDGRDDVVAGGRDSVLTAYRGRDGRVLWQTSHSSGIHASPQVGDFDGDGRIEVLAAWSYGDVAVLDGTVGTELWGQSLQLDVGGIEGLFATPVPLPGKPGMLIAPTSWWGKEDGVVGVGATRREFRSFEGRVTASAVVTDLDHDGVLEAILGTERGELIALRADRGRALLTRLPGGIEASAMLADTDGNGTYELLVASRDGMLSCFETGSTAKPVVPRFRGSSAHNRGDLGKVRLGWKAVAQAAPPTTGAGTSRGTVRIDYLQCCAALQDAATRAPIPHNRLLLQVAGKCNQLAAAGKGRAEAMRVIARSLSGKTTVPAACR